VRRDVIDSLSGVFPSRIPTRETLNHPGLIRRVSGLDPWDRPADAFSEAWWKLSIDVHAAEPASAPRPQVPGGGSSRVTSASSSRRCSRYPGFVLCSCGGLYGNVPRENLLAYFETRDRMGIPAEV
jgi:hypothetical protein